MVPFARLSSMSSSDDCFIFVRTVGLKPFLVGLLDVVSAYGSSEVGVSPSVVIDILGCIVVGLIVAGGMAKDRVGVVRGIVGTKGGDKCMSSVLNLIKELDEVKALDKCSMCGP